MIGGDRQSAEPAGELVQHQAGGDLGGVDRAPGGAAAGLGLGLREQGPGIMLPPLLLGDRQHPDHFPQHSPIDPAAATVLHRPPDRCATGDAVDAAEDDVVDDLRRPKPFRDHVDDQRWLNFQHRRPQGSHLGLPAVGRPITLGGDV